MSHTLGVMCERHERIMENPPCPERECAGKVHGFTYAPCDNRCPDYEPTPVDYVLLGRLLAERFPRPQTVSPFSEWAASNGIDFTTNRRSGPG